MKTTTPKQDRSVWARITSPLVREWKKVNATQALVFLFASSFLSLCFYLAVYLYALNSGTSAQELGLPLPEVMGWAGIGGLAVVVLLLASLFRAYRWWKSVQKAWLAPTVFSGAGAVAGTFLFLLFVLGSQAREVEITYRESSAEFAAAGLPSGDKRPWPTGDSDEDRSARKTRCETAAASIRAYGGRAVAADSSLLKHTFARISYDALQEWRCIDTKEYFQQVQTLADDARHNMSPIERVFGMLHALPVFREVYAADMSLKERLFLTEAGYCIDAALRESRGNIRNDKSDEIYACEKLDPSRRITFEESSTVDAIIDKWQTEHQQQKPAI